jgi:cyclophilin family peptidyl-prolyl cis-trans isomerase
MTRREWWGRGGGSGDTIGVAEFSKRRTHIRGAVGLAHGGDATQADSQIYVVLRNRPDLDGKYTVIGRVTSGLEVVEQLVVTDVIKNVTVK